MQSSTSWLQTSSGSPLSCLLSRTKTFRGEVMKKNPIARSGWNFPFRFWTPSRKYLSDFAESFVSPRRVWNLIYISSKAGEMGNGNSLKHKAVIFYLSELSSSSDFFSLQIPSGLWQIPFLITTKFVPSVLLSTPSPTLFLSSNYDNLRVEVLLHTPDWR